MATTTKFVINLTNFILANLINFTNGKIDDDSQLNYCCVHTHTCDIK